MKNREARMKNTTTMQFLLNRYNATRLEEKLWLVENKEKGWSFYVAKDATYEHARPDEEPSVWEWKIDTQYFSGKKVHVTDYLARLVEEKNTGIRYIDHPRRSVPEICGCEDFLREHVNDSWACRARRNGYFTMICSDCPIAEEIQAKRDGVTLQYGKFDMFESENTFSHVLHNDTFNIRCNCCGRVVLREPQSSKYPHYYYCPHCNKNLFEDEIHVGDWHTGKEFDELRCETRDTMGLDKEEK